MDSGILLHHLQHIACLEGQRFQCRANNVELVHTACKTQNCTSCIGIPVRSPEAGKRRNHVASVGILHAGCKILRFLRIIQNLYLVAKPLNCRSRNVHRAFQRIGDLSIQSPCNRGQKSVFGEDRLFSDVHQHKAPGSVGILRFSRGKTGLSEQRSLLISCRSRNRNRAAEELRIRFSIDAAGGLHLRQHVHGNIQNPAQLIIPLQRVDVKNHRTGSIGVIRDMNLALGQLVNQPAVHGSEAQLPVLCPFSGSRCILKDPPDLRAGKIRIDDQSGLSPEAVNHSGTILQ